MADGVYLGNFRWYLKNALGYYYYVDTNGDVQVTPISTPIQYAPQGWLDTEIEWNRSSDWCGVFRSFTEPYSFVKDGATIINYLAITQGVNAYCDIVIELQNETTTIWETYFTGKVKFLDLHNKNFFVEATISEGGLKSIIDSQKSIDFEIPIDDIDAVTVNLDGVTLQGSDHWVIPNFTLNDRPTAPNTIFPLAYVSSDSDFTTGLLNTTFAPGSSLTDGIFFRDAQSINAVFKVVGSIDLHNDLTSGGDITLKIDLFIFANNDTGSTPINIADNPIFIDPAGALSPNSTRTIDIGFTYSHVMNQNDIAVLVITFNNTGTSSADITFNPGGTFTMDSTFRVDPTTCKGYRYYQVVEKLIDKMTNGLYTAQQNYLSNPASYELDNYPYQTILTCGDAIRNNENPKIVISLNKIFKDATSNWLMGFGVEADTAIFEPCKTFYDEAVEIADLGNVSGLEWEFASADFFNDYKVGNTNQDYDKLNGIDAYNVPQEYKLPFQNAEVSRTEDLVSDFLADPYDWEYTRSIAKLNSTTNSKGDQRIFLCEIEDTPQGDGSYNLLRPAGTITGIIFPDTKFNFGLTPKRKFFRNSGWLGFILDLLGLETITFQTSEKNQNLVSQFGASVTITENSDVVVADLADYGDKIAKPVIFRFKAQTPINIMSLMATNPRGYFSFTWNDVDYTGFPMTVGTKPATHDVFNFVLLATPSCDLTPLIV